MDEKIDSLAALLEKEGLAALLLGGRGEARLHMKSNSMAPLLPAGREILVESGGAEKLRFACVAVFISEGRLVAHRVLYIDRRRERFLQGGDCAAAQSAGFIAFQHLLGTARGVEDAPNKTSLRRRLEVISALFGLSAIILSKISRRAGNLLQRLKCRLLCYYVRGS